MQEDGTGYFQSKFHAQNLRARKLAENVVRASGGLGSSLFLPGIAGVSEADERINNRIRSRFQDHLPASGWGFFFAPKTDAETCKLILEDCDYSIVKMRAKIGKSPARAKLMSAHLEPMVYSVELAGAVLRQGDFVDKMYSFGWTRPGFFDAPDDEAALQHAIARYHGFLDLLYTSWGTFFVPTLDIDLVWHTHQLFAAQYKQDCEKYVRRFINHDDKVDTLKLSNAFDITRSAWKERFGIEYTYCGCPLPGETIGKRLSRFMSSKKPPPTMPSSQFAPPDRADFRIATHASEHNGVIFSPQNETAHRHLLGRYNDHQGSIKKRVQREAKARAKEAKKKQKAEEDEKQRRGYQAHEVAFLYPVPVFYAPAVPGGCVATESSIVNPGGACGSGTGQCGGGGCTAGGCGSAGCNASGFTSSASPYMDVGCAAFTDGSGGGCGGGGCGGGCGGG
ncbi:hypothetical protein BKA70DRAFT_1326677 [Coprinopsis sp. MPI-PUGE-AT-0042]|nr:hypothetical protein BKA70DRAFT_1326677 [Coprinopsis sp. MPI-PUGE-AT-0042]